MKPHGFLIQPRQLVNVFAPTFLPLITLVLALKVSEQMEMLPPESSASDPDQVALRHQLRASRAHHPAEILLTGDSTCWMGVDARELSTYLPGRPPAFNLSLTIGFGLDVYGELISRFATANPGQVRAVVLLVTPATLRNDSRTADGLSSLRELQSPSTSGSDLFGTTLLRRRLLAHFIDTPLRGGGAEFFGFASQIESYLAAHNGSLIDFGVIDPQARPRPISEWTLGSAIDEESRAFRAAIPAGAKLFIGLTPTPSGSVAKREQLARVELLEMWNGFIQADGVLTNLPAILPDRFFSRTGHLNREGQQHYTKRLGNELAALLRNKN